MIPGDKCLTPGNKRDSSSEKAREEVAELSSFIAFSAKVMLKLSKLL